MEVSTKTGGTTKFTLRLHGFLKPGDVWEIHNYSFYLLKACDWMVNPHLKKKYSQLTCFYLPYQ